MTRTMTLLAALTLLAAPALVAAAPQPGAPAPGFTGETAAGETVSLSDFAGATVVLEWTNHLCPFVQKHYETGNMQATQKAAREAGAVWLTVISSAPGKQGHVSGGKALALAGESGASPSHILLDPAGEIGRAYDARTTPHMYLIEPDGMLAYTGAIDDRPSARHETVKGAENYVLAALDAMERGAPVENASTKPYGCSVKY